MSLPHIILGMLRKKSKSGYELKKELEATIHFFWQADISRIYRSLGEMQKKGWVDFETVIQEESPNKKVFSLTTAGRKELQSWLAQPGKNSGATNPFLAQLHFSDAISAEAQLRVLEARLADLHTEGSELERRANLWKIKIPLPEDALRRGVSRELLSLEYGVRRLRFEIEWTQDTIRLLKHALEGD